MGKLSADQAKQLADLEALRDAPDDEVEVKEVTVEHNGKRYHLKGAEAQRALSDLFGDNGTPPATGPKKGTGKPVKKATPAPAEDQADDEDQGDEDEESDDDEEEDPAGKPPHWYFGGRKAKPVKTTAAA
jgi:hypothetical protein